MMSARSLAIANENRQIEESTARATAAAAAKPRNALEALASRLEISPAGLKNTLLRTVFAECKSDEQFMALIVVSNAYGLNPLTKEIYAFPSKGGAVVPMISIDGWIRLMNEHPQFDGIEFINHGNAKGEVEAIEAIVYRKDRNRPVKVIEYMAECKGNTQPWQKSPRRMLRHRALIQGVRIAFGFSGLSAEGDEDIDGGTLRSEPISLPGRQSAAEELGDEIPALSGPAHDAETGEIVDYDTLPRDSATGMTEVSEEEARALDANDGTLSDENPTAAEGPADEDRGEGHVEDEQPAWITSVRNIRGQIAASADIKALNKVEQDWLNQVRNTVPEDSVIRSVEGDIAQQRRILKAEGGQ